MDAVALIAHYKAVRERLGTTQKPKLLDRWWLTPRPEVKPPKREQPKPTTDFEAVVYRILAEEIGDSDISILDVLDKDCGRELKYIRWKCWYRLNREERVSTPVIGKIFRRDHSTIIYGINRHIDHEGIDDHRRHRGARDRTGGTASPSGPEGL